MLRVVVVFYLLVFVSCNPKTKSEIVTQKVESRPKYDEVDRLPEAVYYETDLELEFIKAANVAQKEFIVSEVLITSSTWSSTFSESGQVIARSRSATILVNQEEKCFLQDVIFEQNRNDNKFKEARITEQKGWYTFDCKLLENKNPDVIVRVQSED
ncbi:hypothetical protein [uncultured Croceitalea sp.]|uniref:hypothetical protein n=1 Tax=uncultured Croceitalea sp. TaxID=1798908 RepID=UPI00374E87DF